MNLRINKRRGQEIVKQEKCKERKQGWQKERSGGNMGRGNYRKELRRGNGNMRLEGKRVKDRRIEVIKM